MSVIIKGMDMPTGCGNCPLSYMDTDYEDCLINRCSYTHEIVWNDTTERHNDCPLARLTSEDPAMKYAKDALFGIGEVCVDVSKCHIDASEGIRLIRDKYLRFAYKEVVQEDNNDDK